MNTSANLEKDEGYTFDGSHPKRLRTLRLPKYSMKRFVLLGTATEVTTEEQEAVSRKSRQMIAIINLWLRTSKECAS